jgi:hypothetical protein
MSSSRMISNNAISRYQSDIASENYASLRSALEYAGFSASEKLYQRLIKTRDERIFNILRHNDCLWQSSPFATILFSPDILSVLVRNSDDPLKFDLADRLFFKMQNVLASERCRKNLPNESCSVMMAAFQYVCECSLSSAYADELSSMAVLIGEAKY